MPRTVPPFSFVAPTELAESSVRPLHGGRHFAASFAAGAPGDTALSLPSGLNFSRQDYLALSRNPMARSVSGKAWPTAAALADRVARFVMMPSAQCYGSGTEAIRAAFLGLLQPGDHVVIDAGSHSMAVEAARTARATVHRSPPGSLDGVERRLRRLSSLPRSGQLYVAVASVAALTSVTADLAELSHLCAVYGARLIVDVSHDLGAIGQDGRGIMEVQGCTGQMDVVLGSFAKCFGVAGGFVALRNSGLMARLQPSAPIRPAHAARVLAALDVIESAEGRRRRRSLHGNSLRLRNHLMADGLRVLGQPSPLVPVLLPPQGAEAMTTLLRSAGPLVQLLRAPLVAGSAPRWRILLTSDHGPADIDDLADLIHDVSRSFDRSRRVIRRPVALPQP